MLFWRIILIAILGGGGACVSSERAVAQSPSSAIPDEEKTLGHPVVRAFSPQAYDGSGLVWDVAQDEHGLLYIASSNGLQQYDGARWRYLATANKTTVQSIALDSTGRLHVGAKDELGYYRADSVGRLQYHSLLPKVPESHRPVGDVWPVVATDEGVYFRTQPGVLRWTGEDMQVVTDETKRLFACRNTVYLQGADGMYRVDGATLRRLDGSDQFQGLRIFNIIRGRGGGCEVFTSTQGRFVLTETGIESRSLPGGPLDQPMVSAARGPGGGLAVASEWTLRLIGPEGTIHRLTRSSGLIPGEIKKLYVSRRKALWVATTEGIVRVAWPDPVSVVTEPQALQSVTGTITRHEGQLVMGTEKGVWRVGRDTTEHVASNGHVYSLLSTQAGLLAAGHEGLFVYRDERVRFLFEDDGAYALRRSRRESSIVYATLSNGEVLRLQRDGERWRIADRTDRLDTLIPSMAQTPDGVLWLGTGNRGIVRLKSPRTDLDATPLARYDTADGLPRTTFNYTTQLGDSVRFPTQEGLYRVVDGHFEPDPRFRAVYTDGIRNSWFAELGPDGGVWMDFGGHKLGVAKGWPGDSLRWVERPFRRMADVGDVWSIYPDRGRDSLVWFGADGALLRYDRRLQRFGGHNQPFHTLIRGVQTRDDSLLYGGDTDASKLSAAIGFEHNRIRIQFGATSYEQIDGPTHNWDRPRQYRWKLAGFDETWSDWSTEPHADYTGLSPGRYTIRVEARNLYDVIGREAELSFTVLPPWYRTWWAYGGYGLLALGLLAGAVQWRTRRLRRRRQQLQETVAERTEEIEEQKDQLADQAERLQDLDEAKSRFFANVSHEFRTPLTLIRGPVQEVREALQRGAVEGPAQAEQLAIAERNTVRLQRLIDQILNLAQLDAGTYDLNAQPTALEPLVDQFVRSMEPLAERHGLTLIRKEGNAPDGEERGSVYADREALEHVVRNLLSNAIEVTPEEGRVTVAVHHTEEAGEIVVQDTGPGISEEEQEVIFKRFEQGTEETAGDRNGTGIGLAFAQDLVRLHGGSLAVDSEGGEGTTFTVRLPRGSDHLRADQLSADEGKANDSSDVESPTLQSSGRPPSSVEEGGSALPASAPTDNSESQNPQSPIVLVVDDNADVRRYVRSVLVPEYEVIEAADGADGLTTARETLPDCILADVMMPEMDGIAMVQELKHDAETECIPVVMLTARADAEHEQEGLEAGADDYVTKPFDSDVLRARVAGMIDVRQRLRRRIRAELQARSGDGQAGDGRAAEDAGGDRAPEADPPQLVVPTSAAEESEFVQEVRSAIEEHLAEPDLNVDQIASAVAVSRSTLYRRVKEEIDTTPSSFIRQVRLEHGARLLREGEGTVSEVAYAVGFNSLSYFSRSFRKHFDQSPSEYVEAVG